MHDWHDYQLLERQKGTNPCCKVSSIIIYDFTVGRYAKFDKLFPGCQYVSDTVANVLLDWCSNPEAVSCFVTIGLKGEDTFDQIINGSISFFHSELRQNIMHQLLPSTNTPRQTPREFFEVAKSPAPRQTFSSKWYLSPLNILEDLVILTC